MGGLKNSDLTETRNSVPWTSGRLREVTRGGCTWKLDSIGKIWLPGRTGRWGYPGHYYATQDLYH